MTNRIRRSVLAGLVGATALVAGVPAATAGVPVLPRIAAHFDFAAGETPENLVIEPDGTTDVSFAMANQVAHVSRDGTVSLLAQLPSSGTCGLIFPGPATLGLARAHDGTIYVVECAGNANTGVWRIRRGSAPVQIAGLPPGGFPNGMGIDERTGDLYVADTLLGVVWKVPAQGGAPSVWAAGPTLQKVSFGGANGLFVHGDAIWVSNTDQGVIVRIPIRDDGSAGPVQTVVTGLNGVDDFSVVGSGNTIIATLNVKSQVVFVRSGQQPRVLLTAADGLSNPTSVRVRGNTMYITSAAYLTGTDPNLLIAPIGR